VRHVVFSSIVFLFLFLPLVLLIYHFLPKKIRNVFLMLASLLFYFWGEQWLVWIILVSTGIDYFCGLLISGALLGKSPELLEKGVARLGYQKAGLFISLMSNLAFLAYFKYANFFVENIQYACSAMGMSATPIEGFSEIALPLGISFYTFQSMSYTIDVYRGNVKATRNFLNFACYVTMFPQLVAGPIVRYRDIELQLLNHSVKLSDAAFGIRRFIYGLAKKVLIANTLAQVADRVFDLPASEMGCSVAWLGVVCYALQIYFDFSGYSDMAIGLGHMLGFTFLENFNYPYVADSMQDFWRRWHISLSSWFRDYLYIPLGGNRCPAWRVYMNLLIVFVLCGFWHGASWNFIVWGLFHGCFLILERLGALRVLGQLPRAIRHAYVLLVVLISWVWFRTETLTEAVGMLSAMFGFSPVGVEGPSLNEFMDVQLFYTLLFGVILSTPVYRLFREFRFSTVSRGGKVLSGAYQSVSVMWGLVLFFIVAVSLASGIYNPFIYFRF
jgi:alginate O-acetyltransferase complex protein AlgI